MLRRRQVWFFVCTAVFDIRNKQSRVQSMTKTEKTRWQKLCEVLAREPNQARRARAAASLRRTVAQETKKTIAPNDASLLQVAKTVFRFLEERPWQQCSASGQPQDSTSRLSSRAARAAARVDSAESHVAVI